MLLLVVCISVISAVNAADLNATDTATVNEMDNVVAVVDDECISVDENNEVIYVDEHSTDLNLNDDMSVGGWFEGDSSFSSLNSKIVYGSESTINVDGKYVPDKECNCFQVDTVFNFVGKNDATFDGSSYSFIWSAPFMFDIRSDGVIFNDITFKGWGSYTIYASNSVSFYNCKFLNNDGGIKIVGSGNIIISNCYFENNNASKSSGGAINVGNSANCIIYNSIFRSNSANEYGGAVYVEGTAKCSIYDSSFIGNSAKYGGAIFTSDSGVNVPEIKNCNFENNYASEAGGACYIQSVSGTKMENCSFVSNHASKTGGAIGYYKSNNIDLSDSTFTNCYVDDRPGGAVAFCNDNDISVSDCTFTKCSSSYGGGAIYWENGENFQSSNCTFNNCTSQGGLDAMMFNSATSNYDITDCKFDTPLDNLHYHYTTLLDVNDLNIVLGDDGILNVSLADIRGGQLSNKLITFTFGDKTDTVRTNSKGIATINVKPYLTAVGKFDVNVSFAGEGFNKYVSKIAKININVYEGRLSVDQIGKYYNDALLRFKVINSRSNAPINDASINVTFSNDVHAVTLHTGSDGVADYSVPFAPGTYSLTASVIDENVDVKDVALNDFKVNQIAGVINVSQIGTGYYNSDLVLKLYNPNNDDVYRNVKINLRFITNGEIAEVTTNDDGIATYHIPFDIGTYHVLAYVSGDYTSFDNVEKEDIVIDKSDSDVTFSNAISFGWGGSGSTTMSLVGVSSCSISVPGHSEAKINRNGNTITVSDLDVGTYNLQVVTTPDSNHKSVTKTIGITVNKIASSISGSGIVFDYGGSGSTTLTLSGATGVTAKVVDHSEAKVTVNGNVVTVSGLNAGSYNLQVTTIPDNRHTAVVKNIGITVNKVASSVSGADIVFNYGNSGSTTLTLSGATGVTAKVVNHSEAKITVNGKAVTVSGLNAGSYTLQVTTTPDGNHNQVTKNIAVTVNKVASSVSGSDIIFAYGGSGSTTLTLNGVSSFTANVLNYPEAKISINANKVTVSDLDAGTYKLQVVTSPDVNHNSVTKTMGITVDKVDSIITFGNTISFNVGNLGSTTVDIVGGSTDLSCISVVGHDEAVISYTGNVVSVSHLEAGTYTLNVVVKPDENHNSVNGTVGITVTGSGSGSGTGKTESKISFSNSIAYDWGDSGSTTMALVGCSVSLDKISVVGHSEAIIGLEGNKIVVSNLTPGSYTLKVITTPYENYYSVTNTVGVTVRKIASSVSGNDISFAYGGSGSTTLTLNGATGVSVRVLDQSEAKVNVNGNVVSVSGLNVGTYKLEVVTTPDSNHNSATKTIGITVTKVASSISFDNDIISFAYGSTGSIGVNIVGGTITNDGITVIGHDEAKTSFKNNMITVSDLDVGSYTLRVVTSPDGNHNSVSKTVDVIVGKAKSKVTFTNPVVFDYNGEGTTTLILDGCNVFSSDLSIVEDPDADISIDRNNVVHVKGLNAGNYTLHVVTTPDSNHLASEGDIAVFVNRINSKITFTKDSISFKYAKSGSTPVALENCKVASMSIEGSNFKPVLVNGEIIVSGLAVGSYVLKVTTEPTNNNYKSVNAYINIVVTKNTASITVEKSQIVAYKKSTQWTITLKDSDGKAISGIKPVLKIYNGNKLYKTINNLKATNANGVTSYQTSGLPVGTYKFVVSVSHAGYNVNSVSASVKVIKQTPIKIIVKAKTTKKGGTINVIVKDKKGKKYLNNVKVTIKIKDGKKYKTVTLITGKFANGKGVCAYSTNMLSVGKHAVTVTPADVKYSGSGKATLKIKSSAKKYSPWWTKVNKGKESSYGLK